MLGSRVTDDDYHGGVMSRSQLVTHRVLGPGSLGHSLRTSPMFDSVACLYYGTVTSHPSRHRLSAVAVRSEVSGWLSWDRACGARTCHPPPSGWLPAVAGTSAQTPWRLDPTG